MNGKIAYFASVMLVLGTLVVTAGTGAAHECETYQQVDDAFGCNAHSCPPTAVHYHFHNTPWWDYQWDHGCSSDGGGSQVCYVQYVPVACE